MRRAPRDSGAAGPDTRTGPNAQCTDLAHDEGLRVYTVFIGGRREEALGSSQALVDACSGAADTPDDDRADFHFEADDPATLRAAFEEIGQRLLAVRRTL